MSEKERIENAKKKLDVFASPIRMIIYYFVGALILNFLRVQDSAPWAFMALFVVLFIAYLIASSIKRELMTKEEREVEDKNDERLSGQRGP
jgi:uncharacterized membrane protein